MLSLVTLIFSVGTMWAAEEAGSAGAGLAEELASVKQALVDQRVAVDTVWVLICGILVFFMNTGFGMVETGFTRAKNAVNILSKNFIVFAAASIAFWFIGWGLMFGDGNGFLGLKGLFFLSGADFVNPSNRGAA